jgi:hypothetical protein
MTGLPGRNYALFNSETERLRRRGFRVLNPAEIDEMYQTRTMKAQPSWEWYMRKGIGMVLRADGIAVLPGWESSKGASLEVHIGDTLNLPVRTVDLWVEKGL